MQVSVFKRAFGLVLALGVAGCAGTPTLYDNYRAGKPLAGFPYKAGVGWAEIENDKTTCEIEAAQRVPQHLRAHTTASYTTPVQTTCNRIGTQTFCNSTGGQTYGGGTTYSDANQGLRLRAYGQCMARNGYRFINIPACPAGSDLSAQNHEKVLRPLSRRTCYQAHPSGAYAIGDG